MTMRTSLPALGVALLFSQPAIAADLFGGVFAHDVNTPFTKNIHEGGSDFQLGYRFNPIVSFGPVGGPAPYLFGSVNSQGDTNLIAAGLGWKIGGPFYVRPGLGVAIQTGPSYRVDSNGRRTDLGSRVLFEPELGIGVNINDRTSIEASWVHMSHATLFSDQNPGIDNLGVRFGLKL